MIETRVKFEEVPLTTLFASKRFLLEASIETKLEDKPFTELLNDVRAMRSLTKRQTNVTSLLRTHKPVKLIKFIGMRKYSAEWWVAIVRVAPTVRAAVRETDLLLIGWSNNHGIEAVCIDTGQPAPILDNLEARVLSKTNQDYSLVAEFLDIPLGTGTATIPEIAGLPEPDPLEELFASTTVPVPEPEPIPTPAPHKSKKFSGVVLTEPETKQEEAQMSVEVSEKPKPISKAEARRRETKESFKEAMLKRKEESDW